MRNEAFEIEKDLLHAELAEIEAKRKSEATEAEKFERRRREAEIRARLRAMQVMR
jgi:hypothetical protein